MSLFYRSTRDDSVRVTASQAILKGLAPDGGLFVPESIPSLDKSLEELSKMSYKEVAYEVMKLMLDDFTEEELKNCIDKAYDSKFDTEEIAPLVKACNSQTGNRNAKCIHHQLPGVIRHHHDGKYVHRGHQRLTITFGTVHVACQAKK